MDDLRDQNKPIIDWRSKVERRLIISAAMFQKGKKKSAARGDRTEKRLASSIVGKAGMTYGVIDRVSFAFERHGVFVQKGVGRGYPIKGGFVVTSENRQDQSGSVITSENRRGSESMVLHTPRVAQDWYSDIMDQSVPELADELASLHADIAISALSMVIKY